MEILPTNAVEREKDILWFFNLALWLKVANGALEILGALLVLIIPPTLIVRVVEFITSGEVTEDSGDPITSAIRNAANAFTVHSHYFLSAYLFIHGAIKVILVIGIFSGKRMAYPLFMIALGLFGAYEAYRGFGKHETLLLILAVFDLSVLILTSYEYRQRYPKSASAVPL